MRRFASVFASKRDSLPPLSDPAHSSASSSSGSASLYLRTPDDDHLNSPPMVPHQQSSKKSWKSWLKAATHKHSQKTRLVPHWSPPPPTPAHDFDDHDDSDSDPSEDDSLSVSHPPAAPLSHPSPARARANLHVLVSNSLVPSPSPSPFVQPLQSTSIFPRSSNYSGILPRRHSMSSTMLKTRLLRRLDDPALSLTSSEQLSIASLGSRQLTPISAATPPIDEPALPPTTLISLSSRGLRRWISRPCFEDRYDVFVPVDDGISRQRVSGTSLAVAALEYSEALDAMVDYDIVPLSPPVPAPVIEIPSADLPSVVAPSSPPPQPSSPPHSRSLPYLAVPSPLRNQHTSTTPLAQPDPQPVPPVAVEPPVKRGVRFVEDEREDAIPLGYVLRMKKKREEKAKFLRSEHERRAMEEERTRIEDERRKRDAERAEWEKERRAWEREKRAMDEERQQRLYAEEVAAARLRRETQRAGGVPSSNSGMGPIGGVAGVLGTSASSTSLRELERNRPREARRHSRPVYDFTLPPPLAPPAFPRREASEPNLPSPAALTPPAFQSQSYSPAQSSSSPSSSRPPSIVGTTTPSPIASGSGNSNPIRPASVYSAHTLSSSEDIRQRVAAAAAATAGGNSTHAHNKKRHSIAASASSASRPNADRATSFPTWSGSIQAQGQGQPLMVPSVPPMMPAFVMMDAPLLPPTPPFMLQQYPRQLHQQQGLGSGLPPVPSTSSSPRHGRLSSSANSSLERVHEQGHGRHPPRSASFPHRPEYRQSISSPSAASSATATHRPEQERRASGDPRRTSIPAQQQQRHPPIPTQTSRQHTHTQQRPSQSHSQSPSQSRPSSLARGSASSHSNQHHQQIQQQQLPNPWTGLPSQNGRPLMGMPVPRQQSQSNLKNGKGHTAGAGAGAGPSGSGRRTIML